MGLEPKKHLAKTLGMMQARLLMLQDLYGVHCCGEGGEFDSPTLEKKKEKKRSCTAAVSGKPRPFLGRFMDCNMRTIFRHLLLSIAKVL